MKRVTKDPTVRREELIDIAEELFLKNGYEETHVSEIVKKVEVAQGTFYYYFKSKDEILDALVDRYLHDFVAFTEEQVRRDDINAVEKFINFFKGSSQLGMGKKKMMIYLHEEKNALLHLKIEKKAYPLIVPLLKKIIEQGIKDGLFDTKYPYETAMAFLSFVGMLFDAKQLFEMTNEEKKRRIEAGFYLMEKILGAEHGSLAEPFLNMEGVYEE